MATIDEIRVGDVVVHNDPEGLRWLTQKQKGTRADGFGVVKHVSPTQEELKRYEHEGISTAVPKERIIYFDRGAERHFIVAPKRVTLATDKTIEGEA